MVTLLFLIGKIIQIKEEGFGFKVFISTLIGSIICSGIDVVIYFTILK